MAGGATRETPIAQELNTIGYYVFTVQGSQVTVDYYSAVVNPTLTLIPEEFDGEYLPSTTPRMTFTERESFGFSLNGSSAKDASGRAFTKTIDTGWSLPSPDDRLASDILKLWGLADLGTGRTDTYALSLSYEVGDDHGREPGGDESGAKILVTLDSHGHWVNAVDANAGEAHRFVRGPWKADCALVTFGIDPSNHTAWAVVNHGDSFAVSGSDEACAAGRQAQPMPIALALGQRPFATQ
jgi:hypothetical protein